MIKIEFPSDRKDIALAIGQALMSIGQGASGATFASDPSTAERVPSLSAAVGSQQAESAHIGLDQAAVNDYEADEDESGPDTSSGKVDLKGVPFNPQLCSSAAEPFYASGKEEGQWKPKKGMREKYDLWYSEALAKVAPITSSDAPQADVDVSKVWGAASAPDTAGPKAPTNTGEFFMWVSEMQAGGHLTEADINAAWAFQKLDGPKLWGADAATQVQMVKALHGTLAAKVGG
jgi:hypothetical protein